MEDSKVEGIKYKSKETGWTGIKPCPWGLRVDKGKETKTEEKKEKKKKNVVVSCHDACWSKASG